MTEAEPRARRRWAWLVLGAGLAVAAALFAARREPPPRPDAPAPENADAPYVIEDGAVVWRPLGLDQRIAVSVLSLGLAANADWVVGQPLPAADVASFRMVGSEHGRDSARVWYRAEPLDGADPDSFVALERGFARDRAHLWRGAEMMLPLDPAAGPVRVFSDRIFTVGDRAWLAGAPLTPLPEAPRDAPAHHCRDWFTMNGALWRGAARVLSLDGPAVVLDCDGGVTTRFGDEGPREDIDANAGILLGDGPKIWRARLRGAPALLATLPGPVAATRLLRSRIEGAPVLLALTEAGAVFALDTVSGGPAQRLGRADRLPADDAIIREEGFWLQGRYLTLDGATAPGGAAVTDHGPGERLGDYARAGGMLFNGATIVARPGALPLRRITDAVILVGPSCLDYGHFVTDFADPAPEPAAIAALCGGGRPPPAILYDGLRIGFTPGLRVLGPDAERPDLNRLELGEIFIENAGAAERRIDAGFLAGFELRINGTRIELAPATAMTLEPGQRHVRRPEALSGGDGADWSWVLGMRHSEARAAIFGDERVIIGAGSFGGG
ncbi:MAG: hypothetical protein ACK5JR_18395 [Tropicimonas sp.]|uniref:hypothetical protein n=1 Tax=Tropicimonas sp. TaxID=2067044 RepID=UPI003A874EC8